MDNQGEIQRLESKTSEQRFLHTLEQQYHYAPRIAESILAEAQDCLLGQGQRLQPGQIIVILAQRKAKPGRALNEIATVEVIWTVDNGREDLVVLQRQGQQVLRRVRLMRLLDEALEQGGVATQEDLARALQTSLRTVKRDFSDLQAQGISLPSRGYLHEVGRGQSHKAQIIRRWMEGETYDQIEQHTHHTGGAIRRYLRAFMQVVQLHRQGFVDSQIALLLQMGLPLVQDYLEVYRHHLCPACQERLDNELQRIAKAQPAKKGAQ